MNTFTGQEHGPGGSKQPASKFTAPATTSTDQWVETAVAFGAKEICLTAAHEGGFALWPSNYTNYSVASSKWRGGKGDVLREFADAANRHLLCKNTIQMQVKTGL